MFMAFFDTFYAVAHMCLLLGCGRGSKLTTLWFGFLKEVFGYGLVFSKAS